MNIKGTDNPWMDPTNQNVLFSSSCLLSLYHFLHLAVEATEQQRIRQFCIAMTQLKVMLLAVLVLMCFVTANSQVRPQ